MNTLVTPKILGLLLSNATEDLKLTCDEEAAFTKSELIDEIETYPSAPKERIYLLESIAGILATNNIAAAWYVDNEAAYIIHDRFYDKLGNKIPEDVVKRYDIEVRALNNIYDAKI